MKYTIRRKMFETNSSSMHSIILSQGKIPEVNKNREKYIKKVDWNNDPYVFHIRWGCKTDDEMSFTRGEPRIYLTPISKAKILILIYACLYLNKHGNKVIEDEYKKDLSTFCKKVENLLWDHEGLNVIIDIPPIYESSYGGETFSYVNVDSEGMDTLYDLIDYIDKDENNLIRYLFDSKSFVVLGGDEYPETSKVQYLIKLSRYPKTIIGDFNPDSPDDEWSLFDYHYRERSFDEEMDV